MANRKARRRVTGAALMVGLLIVYAVSPPAAWATLTGFAVAWLLAQPRSWEQEDGWESQAVTPPPAAPTVTLIRR